MSVRDRTASRSSRTEIEIKLIDENIIKDGWLYIARKKTTARYERRYFVLMKDSDNLCHMKSPKDQKTKIITLVLAQVSETTVKGHKNTFQIVSRDESSYLKAESQEEMKEWVTVIKETCSSLLTNTLQETANIPLNEKNRESINDNQSQITKASPAVGNSTLALFLQKNDFCADCDRILSEGYQGHISSAFVSLKIGCVLCEDCAICHYQILGKECSNVHAIQEHNTIPLFDPKQNPTEMAFLNYMGNRKVNQYWEFNLQGYNKPASNCPLNEKKLWTKEKYLRKTFKGQKDGYLSVKSKDKKKSKKYWVVLEVSTINLFNNKGDMKAQEILVLQSCGVKIGDDPTCPESFTLITPGQTFKLEAPTFPAAMEWANAISVASASLMKQLTNSSSTDLQIPKGGFIPNEFNPIEPEIRAHPIRRYIMETDNSEWGRTLTSLLQLQEQIDTCYESSNNTQLKTKKILSLEDQQFEVGSLLFSLPAQEFDSSMASLVRNKNGQIIGGTIESLIEYLTTGALSDNNFAYTWILTYRAITSPVLFLCALSKHFKKNDIQIQKNILAFIESWISNHYYEICGDGNTIRLLLTFLEKTVMRAKLPDRITYVADADKLRSIIRNQMTTSLIPTRVIYDDAPEPIVPEENKLPFLVLNDLDDKEIARQLSLIDQKLFQAIKPNEFLNLNWIKDSKYSHAPNITKFLERYNLVVNWVLTTINKLDKPKRPFMLTKFIQIAKHCKDLRNFNACLQILTAIDNTIMLRFDGTWEGISQKYIPILLELRKLSSKSDNYSNLKQELYKTTAPCVPYLQAYLDEIQTIEGHEPNFLDDGVNSSPKVINFSKFKKQAQIIAEIRRYQKASYILLPQPTIQCFLLNITALSISELSSLAKMSHVREKLLAFTSIDELPLLKVPFDDAPAPPTNEDNDNIEIKTE